MSSGSEVSLNEIIGSKPSKAQTSYRQDTSTARMTGSKPSSSVASPAPMTSRASQIGSKPSSVASPVRSASPIGSRVSSPVASPVSSPVASSRVSSPVRSASPTHLSSRPSSPLRHREAMHSESSEQPHPKLHPSVAALPRGHVSRVRRAYEHKPSDNVYVDEHLKEQVPVVTRATPMSRVYQEQPVEQRLSPVSQTSYASTQSRGGIMSLSGRGSCRRDSPSNPGCYRKPIRYPPQSEADCAPGCRLVSPVNRNAYCTKDRRSTSAQGARSTQRVAARVSSRAAAAQPPCRARGPSNPDCYVDPVNRYPPKTEADCKAPCKLVSPRNRNKYCTAGSRKSGTSTSSCGAKKRASPFASTSKAAPRPAKEVSKIDPMVAEMLRLM